MLREADRSSVAAVAKTHGVSEQILYNWRQRFGEMNSDEIRRPKQLEQENARLKKTLAERDLEIEVMKEIATKKVVSVRARRRQVGFAVNRGLSQRRARTLLSVARSSLRYEPRFPERDAPVLAAMTALSSQYPPLWLSPYSGVPGATGTADERRSPYRLWSGAGLQVPRKRPRRRIAASRPRPATPEAANQVWAYDFVSDACANCQQSK